MTRLSADVPNAQVTGGVTHYHVRPYQVRPDGSMTFAKTTARTLNQFEALKASLAARHPTATVGSLPLPAPPSRFSLGRQNETQVRAELCTFLQVAMRDAVVQADPAMRLFLGLPAAAPGPAPPPLAAAAPRSSKPPANALHQACNKGDAHLTERLIVEAQCDVDGIVSMGKLMAAPIHLAALLGSEQVATAVIDVLLQYRVSVNAVTSPCGRTAVHLATQCGHDVVVRALLAAGASTEVRNTAGQLAIDTWTGDSETALMLTPRSFLHSQLAHARVLRANGRLGEAKALFADALGRLLERNKLRPNDTEPMASLVALMDEVEQLKAQLAASPPPEPEPEPEPEAEAEAEAETAAAESVCTQLRTEIAGLQAEAKRLSQAGEKKEAMQTLRQAKAAETRWAALAYNLEEAWLHDVTNVSLLYNCSAALEAEKEALEATVPPTGEMGSAPINTAERLKAVTDRLTFLQLQVEEGDLTPDEWLAQLTRSIHRDTTLEEALRRIKKNKDADLVVARLDLARQEAAALREQGAKERLEPEPGPAPEPELVSEPKPEPEPELELAPELGAAIAAAGVAEQQRVLSIQAKKDVEAWGVKTKLLRDAMTMARGQLQKKNVLAAGDLFRKLEQQARTAVCPDSLDDLAKEEWRQLQATIFEEAGLATVAQADALRAGAEAVKQAQDIAEQRAQEMAQMAQQQQEELAEQRAQIAAEREALSEETEASTKEIEDAKQTIQDEKQRILKVKRAQDLQRSAHEEQMAEQMAEYRATMARKEQELREAMETREAERQRQLEEAVASQVALSAEAHAAKERAQEQHRVAQAKARAEEAALAARQQELDRESTLRRQQLAEEQRKYESLQAEAQAEQQRWAQSTAAGHEEVAAARRDAEAVLQARQALLDAAMQRNEAERLAQQETERNAREELARHHAAEEQQRKVELEATLQAAEEARRQKESAEQRVHQLCEAERVRQEQQNAIDEWGRADMSGFQGTHESTVGCRNWITELLRLGTAGTLGVPQLDKLVADIDDRMRALPAGMDAAEQNRRFALYLYTADAGVLYKHFNEALRSKAADRFMPWRPFYAHLMKSLRDLPDVKQTVYRGILDPPSLERYSDASKVCWQGFSSTSIDPANARTFATTFGYVFKLKVTNGKDIRAYSWYGNTEGELLLNPNMEFLVTKELHVPEDGDLAGCNVIEMTQIPRDGLWS